MKKLEKIIAVAGFVAGLVLLGLGLYKDSKSSENHKEDYIINTIVKSAGLLSLGLSTGFAIRGMTEEEDRTYIGEDKSKIVYPR